MAHLDSARIERLLLELAGENSLETILRVIPERLLEHEALALARVWLVRPDGECETCRTKPPESARQGDLHLVASRGRQRVRGGAMRRAWTRSDGAFHHVRTGEGKVGQVAASGRARIVNGLSRDPSALRHPGWALDQGLESFAGEPLVHRGDVLGVLGLFARTPLDAHDQRRLRLVADHAAAAIALGRAWEEIESLRDRLREENDQLREDHREAAAFGGILGGSPPMLRLREQVALVAASEATVLIQGESGTGKELVARELHERSPRAGGPLVRVNCASTPESLFESEFFGHARGAFTGATRERSGRFASADGGTLFLDEVGELPLPMQAKLLRVLQSGEYQRVGEDRARVARVRVVAATNRSLAEEVEAGRFRRDLFFRLNVFPIETPPLRECREDLPLLAEALLRQHGIEPGPHLTEANLAALRGYDWPGNVRELQNVLERTAILSRGGHRGLALPSTISSPALAHTATSTRAYLTEAETVERDRENLCQVLDASGGRIYGTRGAAARLGIPATTLVSRLKRHEIQTGRAHRSG